MIERQSIGVLLALAVFASGILIPLTVAGQSTGEIRLSPSDVSLKEGETRTVEINYDRLSAANPKGIEFILEYDPEVISVVSTSKGEYLADAYADGPTTSSGKIEFWAVQTNPAEADTGTVATITIELADGVSRGDATDLTFTKARTIGTESSPKTVGGTVDAIESTDKTPQEKYDVQIVDSTLSLSPKTVDGSSGEHTLKFDVADVSADDERDNITVTLPDSVAVEDITNTTVTNTNGKVVQLVSDDPATLPNPGNKINFAVNPIGATDTQRLNVEIKMTLSAAS